MKAGWKNRIDERRYFEEKAKARIERCAVIAMQSKSLSFQIERLLRAQDLEPVAAPYFLRPKDRSCE